MFVIEVIPLKRGINVESLSYYSSVSYAVGTLLSIPLRSGQTTAVVVGAKPVSVAKTALKTATFSLRKLAIQENASTLPLSLITAVEKMSTLVPASIGAILFSILPTEIRDGLRPYPKTISEKNVEDTTPVLLTDTENNRYIAHKSRIRESFAHRGSVMFVVPTSAEVEEARKKLEGGIENRVITFCSTHTKKQLEKSYELFDDLRHAKLIIATPSYAFLHRHDITTIIVELCGSSHYLQRNRPYLDTRHMLKIYAKESGRSILFADVVPKTEDEILRRDDVYATYNEHTMRLELSGTITLSEHKKPTEEEEYSLSTPYLREILDRTYQKQGHAFMYCARRGIAPLVTCYDCGFIFRCPDSGAPYSLMRTFKGDIEERWFVSATSGKRIRAADVCTSCGSWRLREQGIGIQQVYDHMQNHYPKVDIFLFDHTTATTHTKARKIIDAFYASKKGMLIGTSMTLPYLSKQVDVSAIISYEATRAVPTWRADETIFSLLISLRESTQKDVVVQLRTEPDELLHLASKGLVDQFYDGEIAIRKALAYPPYSVFVLLTYVGTREQTIEIEKTLQQLLREYDVHYYSAPSSSLQKTIRYGLLKIPAEKWPHPALIQKLRDFPPYIKIEINPEKIV